MRCPQCQADTQVLETRTNEAGLLRRRRMCQSCGFRYHTVEIVEEFKPRQEKRREEKPRDEKPKEAKRPRQDRPLKKERRDDDSEDYGYADREELESLGIDVGRGPGYF